MNGVNGWMEDGRELPPRCKNLFWAVDKGAMPACYTSVQGLSESGCAKF